MAPFTFNQTTTSLPGVLVRSSIGQRRVLQLLPFGRLAFYGASDGGHGAGTVYIFDNLLSAQRTLRSGPLLAAHNNAAQVGQSSPLLAIVLGVKTPSTLTLAGAGSPAASCVVTSGDQGTWTTGIKISTVAGTAGSTVAFVVSFPDPITGQTVTVGGKGTAYDNLATFAAFKAVVEKDPILTQPSANAQVNVAHPVIIVSTPTNDGLPTIISPTPLAGGTGGGSQSIVFSDVKAGIDASVNQAFDIGHLVGVYDSPSQAYADGQSDTLEPSGFLRRFIHQAKVNGLSTTQTKQANSALLAAGAVTAAEALNNKRACLLVQQILALDPNTGLNSYQDAAPYVCGLAAKVGALSGQGPATPLTNEPIPVALDVDFDVLTEPKGNCDAEAAVAAGVMLLKRVGDPAPGAVRVVRSVTTAPNGPEGAPWAFYEFSVVRAADAILANVKAEIETRAPKAIGAGATAALLTSLLTDAKQVLDLAVAAQWASFYDPSSISIAPGGGDITGYVLGYSAAPTLPFNFAGLDQTVLPFQAQLVSASA